MAKITLHGAQIETVGFLPVIGTIAPSFRLTKADLSDASLSDFDGKKKILNIVPSLDTGICALSAKRFNEEASSLSNTVVLTISADLPFAQSRFCKSERLERIVALSQMRDHRFGLEYGVEISTGPMAGLLSRAIVVLDSKNLVAYVEQVPEIGQEPNYGKALEALRAIS
jgi:thioredoxin-dependent peroxiredoxin